MKKILIFFLFLNLVFANVKLLVTNEYKTKYAVVFLGDVFDKNRYPECRYYGGFWRGSDRNYYLVENIIYLEDNSLNLDCVEHYFEYRCSSGNRISIFGIHNSVYTITDYSYLDYCKKKSGCVFSKISYTWICNGQIICPNGQIYDSEQEKCISKPECPSGTELHQQAIQKCGGEEFIKGEMCNPDTGEVNIICKGCYEIGIGLYNYCEDLFGVKPRSDVNITCEENQDGSITINITGYTPDLCDINTTNPPDTNDSNSTPGDENMTNPNNTPNPDVGDINPDDDNSSTTPPSDNDDNQCPSPCSIADNVGTETRLDGDCYIITKPVYENCILKYHIDNGICVPGCNDGSDNDLNITGTLNDISGKLNTVNSNLKSISDNLSSIKSDLESNISVDTSIIGKVESSFDDIRKIYTDGYDNFKKNISSIQSKFSELKNMFSGERKIDFSSNDTECFKLDIWSKIITFDLCKPLSYLSPVIVFVLTIILNFYLILFSIKTLFKD